ncbi:hypothetical protein J2S43_005900 [Catenuloplanes nepalensis]|uniref:Uncharacterized protein n=1 Tax=Catenuloplanes nepalensis TaxID=587533 RepID=A0ABT9N1M0_9ACTN|nr:hypothetical protein [Catenuloplanes nepalensis]MDP9797388.1 hypothetical protein [Catenuloplanes nepalensis]
MPDSTGWYLAGPLIAFVLCLLLGGVLRWALRRDTDARGETLLHVLDRELDEGLGLLGAQDFGLLTPAVTADDEDTAGEFRRLLQNAGIRATVASAPDGRRLILVFPEELSRARRLIAQ